MRPDDVSRPRRFSDPARQRWYAHHRAVRFAGRMLGSGPGAAPAASRPCNRPSRA